jgi:hypothetical protein
VAVADLGMPHGPRWRYQLGLLAHCLSQRPCLRRASPSPSPGGAGIAETPADASDLFEPAAQAGIPSGAYAINEDVDGAMCLVRTSEGFEVFNSLAGARHEVRVFKTKNRLISTSSAC